jgi:hypothetical protein
MTSQIHLPNYTHSLKYYMLMKNVNNDAMVNVNNDAHS